MSKDNRVNKYGIIHEDRKNPYLVKYIVAFLLAGNLKIKEYSLVDVYHSLGYDFHDNSRQDHPCGAPIGLTI